MAGFELTIKDLVPSTVLLLLTKLLIAANPAKASPPLNQHDEVRYYVREVEQGGQSSGSEVAVRW